MNRYFQFHRIEMVAVYFTLQLAVVAQDDSLAESQRLAQVLSRMRNERAASISSVRQSWDALKGKPDYRGGKCSLLIQAIDSQRLIECADLLVTRLDFGTGIQEDPGPLAAFPASQALVSMGSAAYPTILRRLDHEATDRDLRIVACIFIKVDGKEIAAFRLLKALKDHVSGNDFQGENHPRTKNLRRLVDLVNDVDFTKPENWP